jgi:hypothetical protein
MERDGYDDIHTMDVRVQSLQTSVGAPKPSQNVVAGITWEAPLAVVGGDVSSSSSSVPLLMSII